MSYYDKPSPQVYLAYYCKPSPQDVLVHHGIRGQKWGKRNGPPYPLDAKNHSASEKRAGWRKSLDRGSPVKYNKSAANAKVNGFGDFPKETVKAAVQVDPSTGFKLGAKETVREAVTKVNPSGGNTNCRACSIASILRMRGMDVEAIGSVQGGSLREAVEECFEGAKVTEVYSPSKERITNYILKRCGEGSSGVMSARYNTPAGKFEHAISWAVKDGIVSFFDGQSGSTDCSSYLNRLATDGSAEIARLDNLELNFEGIKKYIKGR